MVLMGEKKSFKETLKSESLIEDEKDIKTKRM